MLYPCETENGEECWLHVPAGQSHLSQRKDEIHAYVTEVDVDVAEGDILVLSPTRSEQTDRAPVSTTFSEGDIEPPRDKRKLLARRSNASGRAGTSVHNGDRRRRFRRFRRVS